MLIQFVFVGLLGCGYVIMKLFADLVDAVNLVPEF